MAIKVVDASAIAALLFGEPDAEAVAEASKQCSLAAPALLPIEIASVCLKKIKRHPADGEALLAAFDLYDALGIELVEIGAAEALAMARSSGLTVYDACYLWLARALGVELVTLDRELKVAAEASRS